jgi:hypothetical protein
VLAAADGTIAEVSDGCGAGGGADASLFFAFNHLVLLLDDGTTIEYVHIRQGSAAVAVGEAVRKGQKICESGAPQLIQSGAKLLYYCTILVYHLLTIILDCTTGGRRRRRGCAQGPDHLRVCFKAAGLKWRQITTVL